MPRKSKGVPKGGEQAYERLRELIVSLELAPNESIDEKGLTAKLGLGRTPVREALIRLALENLVVIYPRRGTYVAPLDLESLRDLEQLRFNLEAFASALAARHADARDLSALHSLVDEARASPGGREVSLALDRRFHALIAASAKNRYLKSTLERLYNLAMRFQNALGADTHDVSEELADYEGMLAALEARDPERAASTMKRHLRDSLRRITRTFDDLDLDEA